MYVVIAIFWKVEEEILRSEEDDINDLMKVRLRERVESWSCEELIVLVKQLYIKYRWGEG